MKASLALFYVVFIAVVCRLSDDAFKGTEIQDTQSEEPIICALTPVRCTRVSFI